MKKVSTAAAKQIKNILEQKLTIGLDLGDRSSWYCVLDEAGSVVLEQRVSTSPKAMKEVFGGMPRCRIALETGMHSPWVSRLLSESGHEVIVAHAWTALVNTARGLAKSYGERLRGSNVRNMNPEKAEGLSPELQRALEPLLAGIESLSERILECNERIEQLAQESYPQVARLKQVKGVGTLIALTYLLTLEDAHRFRKSRDVGCYLGLQPGRRNSGQSEPQMHISKEGDPYLRTLLVQGAHLILGPFGADRDLRRWGLKLAERGGKNGKKRAVIATARKLAVLLHRLWVSGEAYEPLRNSQQRALPAAA
jgi:transposase